MKNDRFIDIKISILTLTLLIIPQFASANISTQINQPITVAIPVTKELAEKASSNKLSSEEKALLDTTANQVARSIYIAPTPTFGTTSYALSDNAFYLGASTAAGANALTKVTGNQTTRQLTTTALAPATTTLNGTASSTNPLYNAIPSALGTMGTIPVSAIPGSGSNPGLNRIILVTDTTAGATALSNATTPINDATGTILTEEKSPDIIPAVAANNNTIFAAVPASSTTNFGSSGSGITRLQQNSASNNQLSVVNLTTGALTGGPAYGINFTAGATTAYENLLSSSNVYFAFTADPVTHLGSVTLGSWPDLYWSPSMNMLYIGLMYAIGGEEGGSTDSVGSIVSVLTGYVDSSGKLWCYPIVDPVVASQLTVTNPPYNKYGIAFNGDAYSLMASTYKVRTMQTSTGRDYLICIGGVAETLRTPPITQSIFAFPLVPANDGNGGMIASVARDGSGNFVSSSTAYTVATSASNFPTTTDNFALVGNSGLLPAESIQDLRIVGDTVYVAVAGGRTGTTDEAGIFASTAIFDQYGNINSWSAWQRVAGNTNAIYGFGIDSRTSNTVYLATDDGTASGNETTIKSTFWGTSTDVGLSQVDLSTSFATIFPLSQGGVQGLSSFGSSTVGFDNASLLVATGLNTIALVETGKKNSNGVIQLPTTPFSAANNNLRVYTNDSVVSAIRPVCTSTMSQDASNKNWVFVGGYNGLAVLANPTDGSGVGSAITDLSDIPETFTFNQIQLGATAIAAGINFSHIRKIMSDGTYLYVMTDTMLCSFPMIAAFFSQTPTALTANDFWSYSIPNTTLSDFELANDNAHRICVILATNKGLYSLNSDAEGYTTLTLAGDIGPVSQLNFIKSVNDTDFSVPLEGNLYALATDMSQNTGKIYRYFVSNGTVTPIEVYSAGVSLATNGLVGNFQKFRGNFITDGSFIFDQCSLHCDDSSYLNMAPLSPLTNATAHVLPLSTVSLTSALDINTDNNFNMAQITKDQASGAWIVPGDFGIRINQ